MSLDAILSEAGQAALAGRIQEVENACKEAMALAPSDIRAIILLAKSLTGVNRGGESIALFERALALEPTSLESLNWLAMLYRGSGRIQKSI